MNKFKNKVAEISLAVGGSHYPSINTALQEQMVKQLLEECLEVMGKGNRNHIHTTFDLDLHQASIESARQAIKEHFGL